MTRKTHTIGNKAPTTNVADYFEWCFDRPIDDAAQAAQFALSSECGKDCKGAMVAAMAFIGHIRMAHGEQTKEERAVVDTVQDILDVYMYG